MFLLEGLAWLVGPAAMAWLSWASVNGNIASARGPVAGVGLTAEDVRSIAGTRIALYLVGAMSLALARVWSARRGRRNIGAPLLLPAVSTALGLGMAVQMGYGDPVHFKQFPGAETARDTLLAQVICAAFVAAPVDWFGLLHRFQRVVIALVSAVFVALLLFGTAPEGSDQKLSLFHVQPLEFVKVGFAVWLADFLGHRAEKLRWQRDGASTWLRWPRPRVLLPAVVALGAIVRGLLAVHDMGPMAVVGGMFLVALYVVTRSRGWLLLSLASLAGVVGVGIAKPSLLGRTFGDRVAMWQDPWFNGRPISQEVAEAAWSMSSGGFWGQGAGRSLAVLRFGHNDLVLAQLGEDLGLVGLASWIGLLTVIVLSGLVIAVRSRTAERQLMAVCLVSVLAIQAAVIFGGVVGWVPLTGIVAPFLAKGGSATIAFVLTGGVLARLAEDGARVADERVLDEVASGARELAFAAVALAGLGIGVAVERTVLHSADLTLRATLVRLGDGSFRFEQNPRLTAITRRMLRGELLDRNGAVLVGTDAEGRRTHPLGAALGTLVGPSAPGVYRASWMLERSLDTKLRGWPNHEVPVDVWADVEGNVQLAGPGVSPPSESGLRHWTIANPDLSQFEPLIRLRGEERDAAILALTQDKVSRSVTLTLDGGLQAAASKILKSAAARGEAAAAVVIDVDSGEVLARAQWPDFDPTDPIPAQWSTDAKWAAPYGAWPDKTGVQGIYQSGSVFKLYTALTAARRGLLDPSVDVHHDCTQEDSQGPFFTRPGWERPIHDSHGDRPHGHVDIRKGLEDSCNVFFGQVGLDLGHDALTELANAGVAVGLRRTFEPGQDGSRQLASTAFGQGAAALHVMGAARLVEAVAAGGVYRKCESSLERGAACETIALVDEPNKVVPILEGMRDVVTGGTAARLRVPEGLRMYAKTGTADADRFRGEELFGVSRSPAPHSWFVAIAENADGPAEQPTRPGRLAIAVVVPRGGFGAASAGPAAMALAGAARDLGLLGAKAP